MGRTTNHSFSQKTRLNDLWYGIKIWTDLSPVLCDRQTDGRTDVASPRWHSMQREKPTVGSKEKPPCTLPYRRTLLREITRQWLPDPFVAVTIYWAVLAFSRLVNWQFIPSL